MRRQFSAENGKRGIRVVTLRTGGIGDSIPADFDGRDALVKSLEDMTMLGTLATARGRRQRRRLRGVRPRAHDDRGDGQRQLRCADRLEGRSPIVDVSPRWASLAGLSMEWMATT